MRALPHVLLFALLSALGTQGMPASRGRLPNYSQPEAYQVYAAVLEGTRPTLKGKPLIIISETVSVAGIHLVKEYCDPHLQQLPADLLEDFDRKNKAQMLISRKIPIHVPYDLVPWDELTDISPKNARDPSAFWREFYKRYPNSLGYTSLSAVGFNADKTRALVYVAYRCGGTCGSGGYVFLKKQNGQWAGKNVPGCGWIS
jgi:hypothetical protein